jgi:drug/metabolite transporter (DMT)-like permease
MNEKRALLFAIAAVLLWSTVATAFKLTLEQFTPIQMLTVASLVSTATLLMISYFQGQFKQILPTLSARLGYFLMLGLINPFAYYLILFKAYSLLPASQAQTINYSWAITLTLMAAVFLGQRIRKQDYLAATLCYIGVIIIATRGQILHLNFDHPLGIGLALLSTLLWASYWILNTKNQADPVISVLLGFLIATPFCLATALWEGASWQTQNIAGWLSAGYVGLFEMGITFFLWLSALKLTQNTSRVSNLIFISPFISLLLLNKIIGEEIHPTTLIGLVLIILGLVIQQFKLGGTKSKKTPVTPKE